ncbi:hypothetical protein Acr_00g0050680 [Actinidia rufa]|uniref:RNA-directed DNA polymerase n=1 Tax=Actinidia rufa TaxID=165716 RepID=A0A7J0DL90_9ERIC|nr:hypothetical protein Acr_00g0050680 [Actinidia rufa]
MEPRQAISTELAQSRSVVSSSPLGEYRGDRAILTVGCSPRFPPQQFGAVCGNDSSQSSMHLRSRNLPRPSVSSPPGNRSHPMANPGQAPDLEGLHREIHDMAEQMRIMNENNGRLMQLFTAANPPLPTAPPVPDIERSSHSNRSGDHSQNISANRVGRERRQAPSLSLREKSSSKSSKTPTRSRRGRSPHRGDHIRTRDKSTSQKIRDLDARLEPINTGTNAPRQSNNHGNDGGLRPGPLFDSLSKNVPETLSALQSKADKYIAAEELAEAKRRRRGKDDHKRKESDTRWNDYREETRYKNPIEILNARTIGVLALHLAAPTDRPLPNSPERRYGDNRPIAGNIQTIHGGFGSGGCSTSSRKRHARSAFRLAEEEIYNLSSPCVGDQPPITFSNNDLRGLHLPHDDALVVSAVVANFNVQRILIDSGSSADILFVSAFEKMKVGLDKLHPFHTPLIGFGGNTTHPLRWINLLITLGTEPHQTTVWKDFIVVDCPSPYNAILGRLTLGRIKAITSTYHLKMKFSTLTGIGEVKGDQKVARQCFISAMKDPRETENTKPLEEVIPISIHPNYPDRQVMIGIELANELRIALIDFLKKNSDTFAWSQGDVPGIDPEVAMHKLFTKPEYSLVRQKRRKFAPERLKSPRKRGEVEDVRRLHRPQQGLPERQFPLPKIDLIVYATSKHELLSFMDAFSGYHQIKMYPPDVEKTSFITERGLYCYKVMPFGLKNAGATYQRLVNKMFNAQIGKTMEVYIDDMLVKSLQAHNHIAHLEEAFDILRRHRMMLNPSKCIFGVSSRKFLEFLVTKRGIEVNPDQIQALIAMRSPRNIREVQQLTGRVTALNRFVSKSADKCLPFFKILRKNQAFQWSEESKNAFRQLKEYLGPRLYSRSPPPMKISTKTLIGAEARYPRIKKIAYALMIAARKLRHYFQAHSIIVLTDQPLKQILQRSDTSGRLLKWSIELSEFHIEYKPRTAIKAQALADFIVESTHEDTQLETTLEMGIPKEPTSEKNLAHWILFVHGSSNQYGCSAGLVIRAPSGEQMEYAIRMGFQATNNEAEYEALLAELSVTTELGAQSLEVFSDSQLVVNQVQGDYLAKDSRMIAYLGEVKAMFAKIKEFKIHLIPREDNKKADALANLASTFEFISDKCIPLEFLTNPSIGVANQILQTEENPTWLDEIIDYLQKGILPKDKLQARRLQYRSSRFCIFKGRLYKRSFSGPLLRCLRPEEAEYVLREIHESICGNHSGARSLAKKTIRQGYFWPTIERDAAAYIKRCDKCQRFTLVSRLPHTEMVPMSSPWPFAQWGIDILGPLPQAPLQRKFGVPKVIISDNARQFDNDRFRLFCSDLAISHHFSSPGHLQANGQVEVTNRTILRNLKASRIPTGETPYSMVFGTESVIPVEIGMPSFRISNFDKESNEAELRLNLDLLEEKRENAELCQMAYKCQVTKYYNQRVRRRSFLPSDLVLRKVTLPTKEPNAGKLGPTWEGH